MGWQVKITQAAQDDLNALDGTVRKRIVKKLQWFGKHFNDITPIPLTGKVKGFYKLRIGDWCVFYIVEWKTNILFVVYIDHRSKAYR